VTSVASSGTSRNPAQGVRAAKGGGSKPETTLSGVTIFTPKRQMRRDMTLGWEGAYRTPDYAKLLISLIEENRLIG